MAALAAHLFRPFQHPATDSCCTVLCTKCHLSYYKFAAEYSADPEGLRTKRESRQGHLGNAMRESPQSFSTRGVSAVAGAPIGTRTAAIAHHQTCLSVQLLLSSLEMAAGADPRPA